MAIKGYDCIICKDMGWIIKDVPMTDPLFGKAVPCVCKAQDMAYRQYTRLQKIDGLTPAERDLRFGKLIIDDDNRDASVSIREALARRRGIISLMGKPGRGKTTLIIAAVNEARESGIPAIYARVSDVLDYLRDAYNPDRSLNLTSDERWYMLTTVEVLALDEFDQFKTSEWAMEKFLALIDERWRNIDRCVTLLATNAKLDRLPEKITSRLEDRRAQIFYLDGADMRHFAVWKS